MSGNVLYGKNSVTQDNWTGTTAGSSVISKIRADEPFAGNTIGVQSADAAFTAVLNCGGASFARDAIDTRIAGEGLNGNYTYTGSKGGTKGLIDTQTDVGGWPDYTATSAQMDRVRDSDGDGMPDWFETQFGLSNSNKNDGASMTLDKNGRYTNLEMYLHYLVRDIVAAQGEGADYRNL